MQNTTLAFLRRAIIISQAACLRLAEGNGLDRLEYYARRLRSSDPDNLEGQAAAFYFVQLFSPSFVVLMNAKLSRT